MNSRWPIVNWSNIRRIFENSVNIWRIYDISRRACSGHSRDFPGLCCGKGAAKAQDWQLQAHRKLIKYSTIFRKFVEYWWIYDILRWPIVKLSNIWRFFEKSSNIRWIKDILGWPIVNLSNVRRIFENSLNIWWIYDGPAAAIPRPSLLEGPAAKAQEWPQQAYRKLIKYSTIFWKFVEYLMNLRWAIVNLSNIQRFFENSLKFVK